MVSLKDIAAACGVSIATVSKALNNHNDISIETKEYIRKVAGEQGYYPNSAAKALKTNLTYNIGVLFVDQRSSGLAHEFFSSVLDSVRVEAELNGYDITFINNRVGPDHKFAMNPKSWEKFCSLQLSPLNISVCSIHLLLK